MGPRPDGRGRVLTSADFCMCSGCVNGAATGWPRKATRLLAMQRECLASMGPRPDGRGRLRPSPEMPLLFAASMGPRPDGRGRLRSPREAVRRLVASMGPRPDGRGRHVAVRHARVGRRVNGAATGWPRKATPPRSRSRSATGVNGAATGWPRKGCPAGRPPPGPGPASMGPRPDGRGRSVARIIHDCMPARQWGRDRMAAEGVT